VPGHEGSARGFQDRSVELPASDGTPEEIPVDLTKRGDYEPL
jgi:hypothetical protein